MSRSGGVNSKHRIRRYLRNAVPAIIDKTSSSDIVYKNKKKRQEEGYVNMKNLTIKNIERNCNGRYFGSENLYDVQIGSITTDSRNIEKDCLFIPIKGARFDGHDAILEAYGKGALCCLSEKVLKDTNTPYILVESTLQAIKDIAEFYRNGLDVKVVGITGSVGKTSTKEMIACVMSQKFHTLKTQGNLNNELGLPLTIFRLREEHEVAILEMGISDFGEMHRLSKIARPDICVITNIGDCHLENLIDRGGVLKAKTEIFDFMKDNGSVVLNGDDEQLKTVGITKGNTPRFFGIDTDREFVASDINNAGILGVNCRIRVKNEAFDVHIPIPGYHMVYNALAAAAVGDILGLSKEEIKAGIECLKPIVGRNNIVEANRFIIIDDCYNANPASMKASLDVLSQAAGRKVAILGDMFELGEKTLDLHREVGRYAAGKNLDCIICVGTLSSQMSQGALETEGLSQIIYLESKEILLSVLDKYIQPGDTILVKASHGMIFSEVVERIKSKSLKSEKENRSNSYP